MSEAARRFLEELCEMVPGDDPFDAIDVAESKNLEIRHGRRRVTLAPPELLDRLEEQGIIRRLPSIDERFRFVVTEAGVARWRSSR